MITLIFSKFKNISNGYNVRQIMNIAVKIMMTLDDISGNVNGWCVSQFQILLALFICVSCFKLCIYPSEHMMCTQRMMYIRLFLSWPDTLDRCQQ